jgi:hypothetical protein
VRRKNIFTALARQRKPRRAAGAADAIAARPARVVIALSKASHNHGLESVTNCEVIKANDQCELKRFGAKAQLN